MIPNQQPSVLKPVLILACAAVILTVMHLAASFLIPVFLGIFFAALLTPIYRWLKKRGLPTSLALLLSMAFLVLITLLLALLVGRSVEVILSDLEGYKEQFTQRQAEMAARLESMNLPADVSFLPAAADPAALAETLRYSLSAIAETVKDALLIFMLTVFLLVEAPRIVERLSRAFGEDNALPKNVIAMGRIMVSYFGLRAVVNFVNAVATGAMLWIFGIPYVGLWIVLIFFLSFIPYIGAIVSMIPPVLLAYAQGGLGLAVLVGLLAVLINGAVENIIQPMIMGKHLSVSPTVVFLSAMFWVFILGGPGAFLAMPLTMAVLLFMNNFAETRGFAAAAITTPETAPEAEKKSTSAQTT